MKKNRIQSLAFLKENIKLNLNNSTVRQIQIWKNTDIPVKTLSLFLN